MLTGGSYKVVSALWAGFQPVPVATGAARRGRPRAVQEVNIAHRMNPSDSSRVMIICAASSGVHSRVSITSSARSGAS